MSPIGRISAASLVKRNYHAHANESNVNPSIPRLNQLRRNYPKTYYVENDQPAEISRLWVDFDRKFGRKTRKSCEPQYEVFAANSQRFPQKSIRWWIFPNIE
jgi:hypothetical protein